MIIITVIVIIIIIIEKNIIRNVKDWNFTRDLE